jgi:Ca-activated chloride channel family protein
MNAINSLSAGGSTAGGEGIVTAYKLAEKNFISGGNNRVILATDGDFNVGLSSNAELSRLIKEKAGSGVYLSILGFGMGNIRDDLMETLSRDGNGNYSYINSLHSAQKVLVDELASNLFTVADDVKAQVEFNPENVKSYRLIGYENRMMSNRDFTDDTKDAGEIGAGADVVILFEIELNNSPDNVDLKYQSKPPAREPDPDSPYADELFEVRIRFKEPGESVSMLITHPVRLENIRTHGSSDFNFACSVAVFADLLRLSEYSDSTTANRIISVVEDSLGSNYGGYRSDFLALLLQYRSF